MAKRLKNKTIHGSGEKYSDIVAEILSTPKDPESGASFAEIAQTMPVLEKMRGFSAAMDIILEDAEHSLVVDRLESAKFARINAGILELVQDFKDAAFFEITKS